uniref:Uncharacterized protein n=1 Tax=Hyaloperonospora arabidopsidis (strain Emoy2) TaxID=559515 RepID=M4C4Q9_HYAAE
MADNSPRAASPEPGDGAHSHRRPRPHQPKSPSSSSSTSRGSPDHRSLETRGSPPYSSWAQRWRSGSPPRHRIPLPYSSNMGGRSSFFRRRHMSYEGAALHPSERFVPRSRGRAASRSPSRASQHTRSPSRSGSPRSPARSRSRSRSFSPPSYRTFARWGRGGRGAGAGQYAFGRGRGRASSSFFENRQREREREAWLRGRGRGGRRHATFQRGNRFFPKEVRYKTAISVPHGRSTSWDRDSDDGSASLADHIRSRQMRERDREQRGYESGCRRDYGASSRSTSLVRTSGFPADDHRVRGQSTLEKEGEEKAEENLDVARERSVESHAQSEPGCSDCGTTGSTKSCLRRASVSSTSALPPRPFADSFRKDTGSRIVEDSDDEYSSPLDDRVEHTHKRPLGSARFGNFDVRQAGFASLRAESVDKHGRKSATGGPNASGIDG